MSTKNPVQCPICHTNITKTNPSIGCGSCGLYFHNKCAGVTEQLLNAVRKNISKFLCNDCKKGIGVGENTNNDIIKRMEEIKISIENKIEDTKVNIEHRMDNGFLNLETKVVQMVNDFRKEVNTEIANIKSDVANCYSCVKNADKAYENKYHQLQYKNNMLERRLNRSDILISGLNCTIEKIRENTIKIAKFVGVDISLSDINHCCYIKHRKYFIVKLNSVQLRDTIMKNYHKSEPLLLNKIIGGTIESRIYLNDNLSPASGKLNYLCRKLLSEKKIKKFYLLNMDNPKAKILMLDGKIFCWIASSVQT
ncbi:hypothetical protein CVS40_12799 [Lucilia cuprina]|nr:hypothetical protein CVS40_12799 [Lucilia cuprina]